MRRSRSSNCFSMAFSASSFCCKASALFCSSRTCRVRSDTCMSITSATGRKGCAIARPPFLATNGSSNPDKRASSPAAGPSSADIHAKRKRLIGDLSLLNVFCAAANSPQKQTAETSEAYCATESPCGTASANESPSAKSNGSRTRKRPPDLPGSTTNTWP